ncbi:MAG: ATP-binding protein [Spirirestis rafaelensis WJT71-NPBG6]|nr:ATP-binding protein [Spirirestis rafaelensis WJT71-NPBG6]
MTTYKIIIVGSRGAGKTLLLASMHHQLFQPGKYQIFLECDDKNTVTHSDGRQMTPRQLLVERYAKLADPSKDFEPGTVDIEEWHFRCKVQIGFKEFTACDFLYLDYAGGDINKSNNPKLTQYLDEADILLPLLNGETILSLMRGEQDGYKNLLEDLGNMLPKMRTKVNPVHFVISKWDILEGEFSLQEVKDRLLEEETFSNFVKNRLRSNSSVRLIPVSAVGMEFAELQDGKMIKIPKGRLKPYQVEMPLACVLPDRVKSELQQIIDRKKNINNKPIDTSTEVGFWNSLLETVGNATEWFRQEIVPELPPEIRGLSNDILKKCVEAAKAGAQQTREQQEARIIKQKDDMEKSLQAVKDEETALAHAIDVFLAMQTQLDRDFPASQFN